MVDSGVRVEDGSEEHPPPMLTLRKDPRCRAHFLKVDGSVSRIALRGLLLRLRREAGEPRYQGLLLRLISLDDLPVEEFWHELGRVLQEVDFEGPVAVVTEPRWLDGLGSARLPRVQGVCDDTHHRITTTLAWLESEVLALTERDVPTPPPQGVPGANGCLSAS